MNFSKYFIFFVAAVLVDIAEHSDAGLTDRLAQEAEQPIESIAANTSGDKVCSKIRYNKAELNISAEKAKAVVEKHASDTKTISKNNKAIDITLKGLTDGMNYLLDAENAVLDGLMAACKAVSNDEAINVIEEGFGKAIQRIFDAGGELYLSIGAATQLCQAGASQGLNDAITIGADAGPVIYGGLGSAKSLAIQGIKAGKNVSAPAIMASLKGMQSVVKNIFQIQIRSGKKAFDSIKNESMQVNETIEFDLARERAADKSANCKAAIKTINQSAAQATRSMEVGPKLEAINKVRNGLVEACKTHAAAAQTSILAMNDARKKSNQNAAIATVKNAIENSKQMCGVAASSGHQALGVAAEILGGSDLRHGLFVAMTIVEASRMEMSNELESSSILSTQGIQFDEAESGLNAGGEAVAAALLTGLAGIVKAADYAFQQILSA